MRQNSTWLRIVSIVGLVMAITALAVETAPVSGFGTVTSEGVQVQQASQWHNAGITGQGVKVGVIDSGFEGIQALLGTELPATVQARCYTEIGLFTENLSDCENENIHGTLVAESLMDMAPGVVLYIARPSPLSGADLRASVDWMISEGVRVINHSRGWPLDGPGDGTSPLGNSPLNTIDHAVDNDVLWVNAASNDAESTWFIDRPFSDPDGNRLVNFSGTDEGISFDVDPGDYLLVEMRWDDTWREGASRDLDLLLRNRSNQIVGESSDRQDGEVRDYPLEVLEGTFRVGGRYSLSIRHWDGAVPGWTQLLVKGIGPIEHHTLTGSTFNPEESANRGMLAVGTAPWFNPAAIAPYSGRGPTTDGRTKPEVVGADCAATTFGQNFCGTSQASPHVAGMAALVRQRFPELGPVEVAEYLKDHAIQREQPDPNNTWGHGFAVLPPVVLCSNNPGLSADCDALLAARDTLAGTGTLNWSAGVPIEDWDGVTLGGSPLRITELLLPEKGLTGEIPEGLGSLTNLVELVLWGNELRGEIPAELAGLTSLEILVLGNNQLSGTIPTQLGSLTNLKGLSLTRNQLRGEIPAELAGLTSLEILALGGNQLTGTIPTWLGSLAKLERLYLWGNELNGTIPSELGSLTNLEELHLGDNQLSGTIPTQLGDLTNLKELSLWGNELNGTIPAELAGLTSLEILDLEGNQLTGTIPTWLGSLTNLKGLLLEGNHLSGGIPAELASLTSLEILTLGGNQLTGTIPTWLGSLASLRWLILGGNQLTGAIPPELVGLTSLEILSLGGNQLTGSIPTWLGSLASLEELYLSDNQLIGEIPAELGSLMNLTVLHLAGNQLTGCVPVGLGDVADNDFSELGLSSCDPLADLISRYDTNRNERIDRSEYVAFVRAFIRGTDNISRDDYVHFVRAYIRG